MPEIGLSGLMSGDGKRGVGHRPQATAPILDSTEGDLDCIGLPKVLVAVRTSRLCCREAGTARIFAPSSRIIGWLSCKPSSIKRWHCISRGSWRTRSASTVEFCGSSRTTLMRSTLLGVIAAQTRRTERGIELITKAIGLNAEVPSAHNNLGNALRDLKRSEEALASYDKAIALKPDYAEAYNKRGNALQDLKRSEEALASYDKALAIRPDYAEVCSDRGNALRDLKRSEEALASYDKAIALKPDYAEAYNNRGNALQDLKRLEQALASFERALAAPVDDPYAFSGAADCVMKLCDWHKRTRFAVDVNAHVSGKKSIVYPFVLLGYSGDPALQLRCARNSIENMFPSLPPPFWSGQTWHHDKLWVAYLSADFRSHPVAYLTAELFE
jgi:predicted O-linked N-acetylglucosamine transferase (SPINDLY family)